MAIDINKLNQTEALQILNSTPLGAVIDRTKLRRQLDVGAYRIGDGKNINLVKYAAWLARELEKPKAQKQTVAEAMAKELAAKNQARRIAQDISMLVGDPHPADSSRRDAAIADLKTFLETYFKETFFLAWSDDQLKVIAELERAIKQGGLFAFAMPRGSGKSTLIRCAALWAILGGYRRYVCIIGSCYLQSSMLLEGLQSTILGNMLLQNDFPLEIKPFVFLENNAQRQRGQRFEGELTHIQWGNEKLVFAYIPHTSDRPGSLCSGSVITTASLDGNIRGQQHTTITGEVLRPDLVLIDDPQTRESAKSPSQTKQRMDTLSGDVLYLPGPGHKISGLLTCTKIYDGDLADQILDRKKNPEWRGAKMKMVYKFPANMKLWDAYNSIRIQAMQEGGDGHEATEFYDQHREEMDRGAEIAWLSRFNPDEISALQHAMNLFYRDEASFMAEYQNDPIQSQEEQDLIKPEQVAEKFNGRARGEVPLRGIYVTAFIDVHDTLLYWVVCAWEEDFTGYIIDYGTYPDQRRLHFSMRHAPIPLSQVAPQGAGKDAVIQAGLEQLADSLIKRVWPKAGGGVMSINRLLVDSGYKPNIVETVRHKVGQVMIASKGVGITATKKPISAYTKKPGEKIGHYWYVPNVNRNNEFPHILIDTNYWKTFCHDRLAIVPGDKGSLTLFGDSPQLHRLFSQHVANSEIWKRSEANGRVKHEWELKSNAPDNHWFDCLVGCFAAASYSGCQIPGQFQKQLQQVITLSEIQKKRRMQA